MKYGPFARIALRYGAGALLGAQMGDLLARDVDLVAVTALAIAALVEGAYTLAKRRGWDT